MSEHEFGEDVWMRTVDERYGIFRVKDGGDPELMETCRTTGAIGPILVRLGAEGKFLDYCVGLMDGRDHKGTDGHWVGKWLVLPWVSKGARRK